MHSILIVDDESSIRQSLRGVLEDEGYKTSVAESGEACLEVLRKRRFDVVLLDVWLPGMDGLETLEKIRETENAPEVIMISGHGTIETAVRATKLGAYDFLEKPLSVDKTLILLKNAIDSKRLRLENRDLKKQLTPRSIIVGESIPMKALRQQIQLMAPTNGRVLVYGESGTGKELVAHAIHAQSLRKDEMFVEVNCAAIPEDLIETELFGHRKGSFPAATVEKEGKFQKAHGGTLFLDEIGDMSLKTQSKVLRTLEEQRVTPVGSDEPIIVDARVIASTNKDLEEEISKGNFREDLFYRLNVIPFSVPPLRERQEDVPLLARHFLKEFSAAYGRRPREISDDAIDTLMRYSWPGNVRELRNVIERIVIMNPTTMRFDRKHLPPLVHRDGSRGAPGSEFSTLHQARAAYERDYILKKLDENHGNVSRTAEVLGLERSHLYRKMKTLGIAAKE
ncbi:MAG: Fis family transcriptional regulator [Acidobacteria bacterium]|jgi:two-component system nitrogen regulation response regulator NtrX|nr:MAG: Fis family transcriptional regulator [Acidobacteriales bacterium 13_1_40CM_3_55_5]PYV98895.1 MAG: Fis family transcriptional regulator [Acidobacteriota bacterium]PYX10941.1 MAG: Fis family transcriptional regulator [Acidobacteriota bacterium]